MTNFVQMGDLYGKAKKDGDRMNLISNCVGRPFLQI
jgi:hypothetical protein